jgi:hypothetical protein
VIKNPFYSTRSCAMDVLIVHLKRTDSIDLFRKPSEQIKKLLSVSSACPAIALATADDSVVSFKMRNKNGQFRKYGWFLQKGP